MGRLELKQRHGLCFSLRQNNGNDPRRSTGALNGGQVQNLRPPYGACAGRLGVTSVWRAKWFC